MASDEETFVDVFLDACLGGLLPAVQEGIASGRLTVENLEEGLALATEKAMPDIVATLFTAGARMTDEVIDFLPGEHLQQKLSVLLQFLDHGLDPNTILTNGEPLINFLDIPCTSEMLSRGANPDVSGPRTKSPLCGAMINGNEPLAELLLAHGAKLEPDLLFVTTGPRRLHGERMTKFLLDHGVNPNTTSAEWGTPLHLAVSAKKPNVIKLLLDAGADRSVQSTGTRYTGRTPLQIAQMYSMVDPDITEVILSLLQS